MDGHVIANQIIFFYFYFNTYYYKLWKTGVTLRSPIHAAKFSSAVNAKNDDDDDYYYYYVLIVARNLRKSNVKV